MGSTGITAGPTTNGKISSGFYPLCVIGAFWAWRGLLDVSSDLSGLAEMQLLQMSAETRDFATERSPETL